MLYKCTLYTVYKSALYTVYKCTLYTVYKCTIYTVYKCTLYTVYKIQEMKYSKNLKGVDLRKINNTLYFIWNKYFKIGWDWDIVFIHFYFLNILTNVFYTSSTHIQNVLFKF